MLKIMSTYHHYHDINHRGVEKLEDSILKQICMSSN